MSHEPTLELFVPGRICLFGEHSDWAGGYRRINSALEKGFAIITGTNQGLYARVRKHEEKIIVRSDVQGEHRVFEIALDPGALLQAAQKGDFWSYAAGVSYQILTHYHVRGIEIDIYKTDLPIQKGLSSSAAFCVLVTRAFNRIYDLRMTTRGEMDLAYRGEITTPSRCGRMDQGCAYGTKPILMSFDGDAIDVTEFPIEKDLHLVVVNLGAHKNTIKILRDLNKSYPFADDALQQGVQTYLGPVNKALVERASAALRRGDPAAVGKLMNECQAEFDRHLIPACPEELTAPVLHSVLLHPSLAPHVLGGKGVGSQGDGTAQFVVTDKAAQDAVIRVLEKELGMQALALTISKTKKVSKAVITAAGAGTRLFPMTKLVRKEFLPVLDKDGVLKPLLLQNIEAAVQAGIEEIFLIIREEEREMFETFFKKPVPIETFAKLSRENQEYSRYLEEIGAKITFVHQSEQQGLAHALYQTRYQIGNQPLLLILGDHMFVSKTEATCTSQLLDAFEKHERNILGLHVTPADQIHRFGCVTGKWDTEKTYLTLTEFAEKPSVEYASEFLQTPEIPEHHYLTVFGQYVLLPEVFEHIDRLIQENKREQNEFQLTTALEMLRKRSGFDGIVIRGERYDVGTPSGFRAAVDVSKI